MAPHEMFVAYDFIPKRVTQHGIFVSSSETEAPNLKPGQKDLHRRGLYTVEAKTAFAATTYLALDLPARTEYTASNKSQPEHYMHRDELSARRAQQGASPREEDALQSKKEHHEKVSTGAAHWQSEYKALGGEAGMASLQARRDARGAIRLHVDHKVGMVGCSEDGTANRDFHGRYGSNPRDRIQPGDSKLPVFRGELLAGSTKASCHIPNYQGFIPSNPVGEASVRAAAGEVTRSVDKTNMVDIVHRNIVGYQGHLPRCFLNDFGGRKPTTLTVHGSDYAPLKTARF